MSTLEILGCHVIGIMLSVGCILEIEYGVMGYFALFALLILHDASYTLSHSFISGVVQPADLPTDVATAAASEPSTAAAATTVAESITTAEYSHSTNTESTTTGSVFTATTTSPVLTTTGM